MFERFTERARQVVVLAQEEARALKHNYIGTEHILLGLLREEQGLAARVLESLEVTLERVRERVGTIVGAGEEAAAGAIPFTPRAKTVLEMSLREALALNHNYIGTEHILLGLIREDEGVAARILLDLDADSETIRHELLRMLGGPGRHAVSEGIPPSAITRPPARAAWLSGLGPVLDQLGPEIRDKLHRDPDIGDLLLVLACAAAALPGRALAEVGVELDALWGTLERVRADVAAERAATHARLAEQIDAARTAKEQAIEAQEFDRAAASRDRERELTEQQARAAQGIATPELLAEVRRRLGIPDTD